MWLTVLYFYPEINDFLCIKEHEYSTMLTIVSTQNDYCMCFTLVHKQAIFLINFKIFVFYDCHCEPNYTSYSTMDCKRSLFTICMSDDHKITCRLSTYIKNFLVTKTLPTYGDSPQKTNLLRQALLKGQGQTSADYGVSSKSMSR